MEQIAYWLGYWAPVWGPVMLLTLILWLLLPFAVFGIKRLLKDILSELRRINQADANPR
jgi:heme exporter protein D